MSKTYYCKECGEKTVAEVKPATCPGCNAGRSSITERAFFSDDLNNTADAVVEDRVLATFSPRLNELLGGGFVPGTMVMLGGDPAAGKSSFGLRIARDFALEGNKVLYVAAEESKQQIKSKLDMLNIGDDLSFLKIHHGQDSQIILQVMEEYKPTVIFIDSVNDIKVEFPGGSAHSGTPAQIKSFYKDFHVQLKRKSMLGIMLCQSTKNRTILGPKEIEHAADIILKFTVHKSDPHYRELNLTKIKNQSNVNKKVLFCLKDGQGLVEAVPSVEPPDYKPKVSAIDVFPCVSTVFSENMVLNLNNIVISRRNKKEGIKINGVERQYTVVQKLEKLIDIGIDISGLIIDVPKPASDLMDLAYIGGAYCYTMNYGLSDKVLLIGEVDFRGEINKFLPEPYMTGIDLSEILPGCKILANYNEPVLMNLPVDKITTLTDAVNRLNSIAGSENRVMENIVSSVPGGDEFGVTTAEEIHNSSTSDQETSTEIPDNRQGIGDIIPNNPDIKCIIDTYTEMMNEEIRRFEMVSQKHIDAMEKLKKECIEQCLKIQSKNHHEESEYNG